MEIGLAFKSCTTKGTQMHKVEPKAILVAQTQIDGYGLQEYLNHIGAPKWGTDAHSDVEEIIEVMGRGCYKSFGPGLNKNVTKVREGNEKYLEHIVGVRHGSVLEHGWASFMLIDVSRVFTHELVRHRAGTAISQESLRFVRADDLGLWIPPAFMKHPDGEVIFAAHWRTCEEHYQELLKIAAVQEGVASFDDLPFEKKKYYTSAARRVLPEGMATNIGWSCNMRSLRAIIEQRTDPASEEEIRFVFAKVATIADIRWPRLFADYKTELVNGIPWFKTENRKI